MRHKRLQYNANQLTGQPVSDGSEIDAATDGYGRQRVIIDAGSSTNTIGSVSLNAGSNLIGQVQLLQDGYVISATNPLKEQELYSPQYEDNSNGVAFIQTRAIATATGAWSTYASAKIGTGGVNLKASAGRLKKITVTNIATTAGFLIITNLATAPVTSATGIQRYVPGAIGTYTWDWGTDGVYFTTGIGFGIYTTDAAAAFSAASFYVDAQYI
jgi:hypothetical protein